MNSVLSVVKDLTSLSTISAELESSLAKVTLKNPPLNIITLGMMDELASALAEIEQNSQVSTILICGEGKCFSAGVDVAAHTPDQAPEMLAKFHTVIRALVASRKVTVAAVHGRCLGGAAELAMVCDLVFTADDAEWGLPEIKLGCYPPVACTALASLIGQKRAAELILTGRKITGSEAAAIGLAIRAVSQDQLDATIEEAVQRLSQLSPAALALTKNASYAWDSIHFDKGLARAERIYLDELIKTEDASEGIASFLEKRPPNWKGK